MKTTNARLDLSKVKDIIFNDIFILLDSFKLEYTQDRDNIFMRCPIHEGSDNQNGLSISLNKQMWKCWTRGCHDHFQSDIFGLIKGLLDTESFSEVLKYTSKLYNFYDAKSDNIIIDTGSGYDADDCYNDFNKIVSSITRSKNNPEGCTKSLNKDLLGDSGIMSPYFLSRGFKEETLKFFEVKETKDRQGIFRHRAIIPIRFKSHAVGFIARATKEWIQPKYIFSEGLRKTDYLYNFDNAISSAQDTNSMFLVEGQGDVWRLWECGVRNCVGLFGKDISGAQRSLLLNSGVTTLVVLTDNDQAGRESKIKINRDLGRLFKLIFPNINAKDIGSIQNKTVKTNILKDLKGYYQ
jgi:5S rRNA maturation endonuclease (ribonuclease M5)